MELFLVDHFDVWNKDAEYGWARMFAIQPDFAMIIVMFAKNDSGLDVVYLQIEFMYINKDRLDKNKLTTLEANHRLTVGKLLRTSNEETYVYDLFASTPSSTQPVPSVDTIDEFWHGLIAGPYGISTFLSKAAGTRATIIRSNEDTD